MNVINDNNYLSNNTENPVLSEKPENLSKKLQRKSLLKKLDKSNLCSTPFEGRRRKEVSFGQKLTPEYYDKHFPPDTPLKKGSKPEHVFSKLQLEKSKDLIDVSLHEPSSLHDVDKYVFNLSPTMKNDPQLIMDPLILNSKLRLVNYSSTTIFQSFDNNMLQENINILNPKNDIISDKENLDSSKCSQWQKFINITLKKTSDSYDSSNSLALAYDENFSELFDDPSHIITSNVLNSKNTDSKVLSRSPNQPLTNECMEDKKNSDTECSIPLSSKNDLSKSLYSNTPITPSNLHKVEDESIGVEKNVKTPEQPSIQEHLISSSLIVSPDLNNSSKNMYNKPSKSLLSVNNKRDTKRGKNKRVSNEKKITNAFDIQHNKQKEAKKIVVKPHEQKKIQLGNQLEKTLADVHSKKSQRKELKVPGARVTRKTPSSTRKKAQLILLKTHKKLVTGKNQGGISSVRIKRKIRKAAYKRGSNAGELVVNDDITPKMNSKRSDFLNKAAKLLKTSKKVDKKKQSDLRNSNKNHDKSISEKVKQRKSHKEFLENEPIATDKTDRKSAKGRKPEKPVSPKVPALSRNSSLLKITNNSATKEKRLSYEAEKSVQDLSIVKSPTPNDNNERIEKSDGRSRKSLNVSLAGDCNKQSESGDSDKTDYDIINSPVRHIASTSCSYINEPAIMGQSRTPKKRESQRTSVSKKLRSSEGQAFQNKDVFNLDPAKVLDETCEQNTLNLTENLEMKRSNEDCLKNVRKSMDIFTKDDAVESENETKYDLSSIFNDAQGEKNCEDLNEVKEANETATTFANDTASSSFNFINKSTSYLGGENVSSYTPTKSPLRPCTDGNSITGAERLFSTPTYARKFQEIASNARNTPASSDVHTSNKYRKLCRQKDFIEADVLTTRIPVINITPCNSFNMKSLRNSEKSFHRSGVADIRNGENDIRTIRDDNGSLYFDNGGSIDSKSGLIRNSNILEQSLNLNLLFPPTPSTSRAKKSPRKSTLEDVDSETRKLSQSSGDISLHDAITIQLPENEEVGLGASLNEESVCEHEMNFEKSLSSPEIDVLDRSFFPSTSQANKTISAGDISSENLKGDDSAPIDDGESACKIGGKIVIKSPNMISMGKGKKKNPKIIVEKAQRLAGPGKKTSTTSYGKEVMDQSLHLSALFPPTPYTARPLEISKSPAKQGDSLVIETKKFRGRSTKLANILGESFQTVPLPDLGQSHEEDKDVTSPKAGKISGSFKAHPITKDLRLILEVLQPQPSGQKGSNTEQVEEIESMPEFKDEVLDLVVPKQIKRRNKKLAEAKNCEIVIDPGQPQDILDKKSTTLSEKIGNKEQPIRRATRRNQKIEKIISDASPKNIVLRCRKKIKAPYDEGEHLKSQRLTDVIQTVTKSSTKKKVEINRAKPKGGRKSIIKTENEMKHIDINACKEETSKRGANTKVKRSAVKNAKNEITNEENPKQESKTARKVVKKSDIEMENEKVVNPIIKKRKTSKRANSNIVQEVEKLDGAIKISKEEAGGALVKTRKALKRRNEKPKDIEKISEDEICIPKRKTKVTKQAENGRKEPIEKEEGVNGKFKNMHLSRKSTLAQKAMTSNTMPMLMINPPVETAPIRNFRGTRSTKHPLNEKMRELVAVIDKAPVVTSRSKKKENSHKLQADEAKASTVKRLKAVQELSPSKAKEPRANRNYRKNDEENSILPSIRTKGVASTSKEQDAKEDESEKKKVAFKLPTPKRANKENDEQKVKGNRRKIAQKQSPVKGKRSTRVATKTNAKK